MNLKKREGTIKFSVIAFLIAAETALIIWFSLSPYTVAVETGFSRPGDAEHLAAYFVYGFLWRKFLGRFSGGRKVLILPVLFGLLLGGFCEGLQFILPYRSGDLIDLIADASGAFLGAVTVQYLNFKERKIY